MGNGRGAAPEATAAPPGPSKLVDSGPGMPKQNGVPGANRRPAAGPGGNHVGSASPPAACNRVERRRQVLLLPLQNPKP